jgi:predicted nucleic acid-binding protein
MIVVDASAMVELLLDTEIGRRVDSLVLDADARRVFDLRHNASAHDAIYLALAEALPATLVTCDRALAKVPGRLAHVECVV